VQIQWDEPIDHGDAQPWHHCTALVSSGSLFCHFLLHHMPRAEQDQVNTVSTSVDELATIKGLYVDLFGAYTQLNGFWLGLFNDTQSLVDMDDAVAIEIGLNSLADPSAILAGMQVTDEMVDATTTYLGVLNE
jgi:hypothetical protein